jgi:serine/threonine protein kinase
MKCPSCQAENLSDSRFCHRCATPLSKEGTKPEDLTSTFRTHQFDLSRGDVFAGRYEILEDLGQGGMGKVYKVLDHKIKETVALKLIRPEISVNEKAIERFRNELKFARKISHRNVCRMYDLGEEGFFHYITMEYVEGEDLKCFIRRSGQLTPTKSLSIAIQVCEGLGEAHRLGVVHRDLKPQNIMIDKEGNARIMDFGIARFREAEGVTGSGVMIGTPEYMSPEQAELKEIDKRSDIYSLGVILYEMVSGRVPFEGATPLSVIMKHKAEKPRDVRELRPHISPDAAALISKCLEKDPGKRYQTTEELIADLNKMVKEAPAGEKEPSPKKEATATKQITVTFQARKLVIPAAAVLALAVAAVLVWQLVVRPRGEPEISPESVQLSEDSLTGGIESNKSEPPPGKKRSAADTEKAFDKSAAAAEDKTKAALTPKTEPALKKQEKKAPDISKSKEAVQPATKIQAPVEPQKLALTETEIHSLQLSKARLMAAKSLATNKGLDAQNLLFKLAGEKELAAESAIGANDFSVAKSLLTNGEVVYRLSLKCKTDLDCAKALQDMADDLRKKAEKSPIASFDSDLYAGAKRFDDEGKSLLKKKEYEKASKSFIEAIVLYDKVSIKSQLKND